MVDNLNSCISDGAGKRSWHNSLAFWPYWRTLSISPLMQSRCGAQTWTKLSVYIGELAVGSVKVFHERGR